jgi:hypothetical protein
MLMTQLLVALLAYAQCGVVSDGYGLLTYACDIVSDKACSRSNGGERISGKACSCIMLTQSATRPAHAGTEDDTAIDKACSCIMLEQSVTRPDRSGMSVSVMSVLLVLCV